MQEQCSCVVVVEEENFAAGSTTVWVLFESYDYKEDNKRGMMN